MSDAFAPNQPAKKSGSGLKIALIAIAIIFLLGIVACGGVIWMGMYGINAAMTLAMQEELGDNPVVLEEIGEIQSIKMNYMETSKRSNQQEGDQVFVCDITGTKGSGKLIVGVGAGGGDDFETMTLELADGRTVEIPLDKSMDDEFSGDADFNMEDTDIDMGDAVDPVDAVDAANEGN